MKNKVLKAIAYIVGTLWIISACAIDSESWIPTIVCVICTVYLALFSYANNWFEDRLDE
jgi:hypothetical protein